MFVPSHVPQETKTPLHVYELGYICAPCGIDYREIQEERTETGSETSGEHAEKIPDPHPQEQKKLRVGVPFHQPVP